MKKKLLLIPLALILAVSLVACAAPAPAPAPTTTVTAPAPAPETTPPMPDTLIIGVGEVGSGGYNVMGLISESIIENYPGLKVRNVPAGVETGRAWMVRIGDSHTSYGSGGSIYMLTEGLMDYSTIEWGPQNIRYLWTPMHIGVAFPTRGDSGITSIADLKGKKVAIYAGTPAATQINEAILAFAGLTWDDVIPTEVPSHSVAYSGVVEGKLDAAMFNVASSKAYEGASLACGWNYLEMPASDTEGWARVHEVSTILFPRVATAGGGITAENPVEIMTMSYPSTFSYPSLDDDIAYWVTRALHESYPVYSVKDDSLKNDWTIEKHWYLWELENVPMHNGSIQYFEEIGQWTPEREKMNQERIAYQVEIRAIWDKFVDEAIEAGAKSSDIPELWLQKRADLGLRLK